MRSDQRSAESALWRHLYKLPEWGRLRAEQLARHPFCELAHGKALVLATVVNHRKPHKGDLALFRDPSNLQSVCKPHHDGPIQRAENKGFSGQVDPSGYPVDPAHPANR